VLTFAILLSHTITGKEKHCVSHPGSISFRRVIEENASKYQEAVTKQDRMQVTKTIYDYLGSQNSRFLKYNTSESAWEELTSLLARDKISHALRFANREKKTTTSANGKTKMGHRRNGSDGSADSHSTLTTVGTELSLEEHNAMDDEPLEWKTDAETSEASLSTASSEEEQPYVYEVPYGSEPEPYPAPEAYHHHTYPPPPPPPHYGPHHYYHPYPAQPYSPRPYYQYPRHQQSEYQYMPPPPSYYHPYGSAPPPPREAPMEKLEVEQQMSFPNLPHPEPPVRQSSMDVDLAYLVSEPLMDWDLETDEVFEVQ